MTPELVKGPGIGEGHFAQRDRSRWSSRLTQQSWLPQNSLMTARLVSVSGYG